MHSIQRRIQKIQKEGPSPPPSPLLPPPPPNENFTVFRTCSNKVTLTFQKYLENTRKNGGGGGGGAEPPRPLP